ncbi:MAG: hypothetical protein MZV70_53570 [Desulfobacterales bacterium]|nr:hypothetical protein [Desulfobacterales bacterium]
MNRAPSGWIASRWAGPSTARGCTAMSSRTAAAGTSNQPAEGALGLKMVEIKTLGAPLWSGTAWMNDQNRR